MWFVRTTLSIRFCFIIFLKIITSNVQDGPKTILYTGIVKYIGIYSRNIQVLYTSTVKYIDTLYILRQHKSIIHMYSEVYCYILQQHKSIIHRYSEVYWYILQEHISIIHRYSEVYWYILQQHKSNIHRYSEVYWYILQEHKSKLKVKTNQYLQRPKIPDLWPAQKMWWD